MTTPSDDAATCAECKGRGWHVGDCHPRETCGFCDGTGKRLDAATRAGERCARCNGRGWVYDTTATDEGYGPQADCPECDGGRKPTPSGENQWAGEATDADSLRFFADQPSFNERWPSVSQRLRVIADNIDRERQRADALARQVEELKETIVRREAFHAEDKRQRIADLEKKLEEAEARLKAKDEEFERAIPAVSNRHENQARRLLGVVYRCSTNPPEKYPEIGAVEVQNAVNQVVYWLGRTEHAEAQLAEREAERDEARRALALKELPDYSLREEIRSEMIRQGMIAESTITGLKAALEGVRSFYARVMNNGCNTPGCSVENPQCEAHAAAEVFGEVLRQAEAAKVGGGA